MEICLREQHVIVQHILRGIEKDRVPEESDNDLLLYKFVA